MLSTQPLYLRPAAAYVIGALKSGVSHMTGGKSLDHLDEKQISELIEIGYRSGFKMHRFKRTMGLPRVQKVIGYLQGLNPVDLLDIGTGRGVFLWPLLDTFPVLPVTCLDKLPHRIELLKNVKEGGISNLNPITGDILQNEFNSESFDVVTFLETLEHTEIPETALLEAVRIAKRAVILSVPSKEDDNPEHIHYLREKFFTDGLQDYHSYSVKFDYVLNHMLVLIIKKSHGTDN